MNINFENYNFEEFTIKEGVFCNVPSKLIIPNHIGTKFNQKNKIFRSSIWTMNGELLSASLPKFTNFGENPDNFPVPLTIDNCNFVEKIDGSLVCIDYVNNILSMRTRGVFSYNTAENSFDFEYCLLKYPRIEEWIKANPNYSLICEITTPNLKIVIDYGNEPDFWLIGAVNKNDYSLMTQKELKELSNLLGIKRPETFTFNSIDELITVVSSWSNNKEGVCLYCNNDQSIFKIKADVYLKLHRFKENATIENTIDLFISYNYPSYLEFEKVLNTQFDYECWKMVQGFASDICTAWKEVKNIENHMLFFIENIKSLPTRKEQALTIFKSYGKETNRSSFLFKLLNGESLNQEDYKKLLYQVLKK